VWGWGVLSREVFLAAWVGLFLTAGMFLFGRIRLKGETELEIGPWRMVGGLANLMLAGYFALGVIGYDLDDITTALLPNYRSGRLGVGSAEAAEGHTIIKDDLAAAIELARNEHKLLLINFTASIA
jgi:thiol:disulfide interchange protein DsbD